MLTFFEESEDFGGGILLWSLIYDRHKITETLLEKGEKPHADEYTDIHFSAAYATSKVMDFLFGCLPGESVSSVINARDPKGRTPLHYAITDHLEYGYTEGRAEMVEYLIKQGADINAQNEEDGSKMTPLNYLLSFTLLHSLQRQKFTELDDQIKSAEHLINYGADVNILNAQGDKAFDAALNIYDEHKMLSTHFLKMIVESPAFDSTQHTITEDIHSLLVEIFSEDEHFFSQSGPFCFKYEVDDTLESKVKAWNDELNAISDKHRADHKMAFVSEVGNIFNEEHFVKGSLYYLYGNPRASAAVAMHPSENAESSSSSSASSSAAVTAMDDSSVELSGSNPSADLE